MVVLEKALSRPHPELDLVTTPAGDPVAMVHCNNGASELGAWAAVFGQFAAALAARDEDGAAARDEDGAAARGEDGAAARADAGPAGEADAGPAGGGLAGGARAGGARAGQARPPGAGEVFEVLFQAALAGEPDGGGLLAYNLLSGEPVVGLTEGRPLIARTPDSRLTLANFMRAEIYAAFAALALGMRVLAAEDVRIEAIYGHGGVFKTPGVAERLLAAAVGAPVGVAPSAAEGGAWGIALLAGYLEAAGAGLSLAEFLDQTVFAAAAVEVTAPRPEDVAGFASFLERYQAGLAIERAAVAAI
jgi:hypothetical protein